MASEFIFSIKEEVTCPICLELLTEPVSIPDCGHTFCQDCIQLDYEKTKDHLGKGICPVCRVSYLFATLRLNRHAANIVERVKALKLGPEEEHRCERHGEKLQLFCEEDKQPICWLCERAQEHRGHPIVLIEEVAQKYREKLQAALQKLRTNKKEFEHWEDDLQKERSFWQNKIQSDIQNVQGEFKQLRDILDAEEKNEVRRLKQEEEDILNSLSESEDEQVQQMKVMGNLISDLERRLQESTMEMLQSVDSIINRSETLMLKKPKIIPRGQRRVFLAPDLKRMLQALGELAEARCYWVQVTLAENNHPNIVITEDKRQVKYQVPQKSFLRQDESRHEGVLGHPAIQSGKHYWEVDVSGKRAWILGLSDGSYFFNPIFESNNQRHSLFGGSTLSHPGFSFGSPPHSIHGFPLIVGNKQNYNYQPKYGFWVIGRQTEFTYTVFEECSFTQNPRVLTLSLTDHPSRVGVFLDYEAHTLSFYDVSNHGVLIHRFSVNSFPDKVFPYFNPMCCSEPMSICWPNS